MTLAVPSRPDIVRPHWRYTARQILWAAVDVVFPPQCGGCQRPGERWCQACQATIPYLSHQLICERCGYPRPAGSTGPCTACQRISGSTIAGIRSATYFAGPIRQALHRLKYKQDRILADTLAALLHTTWQAYTLPGDMVIPVPLSHERSRERGYNQAGLLARGFAELARLPYVPRGAQRVRHTISQVGLSASQRRANVADAFQGQPARVAGRSVILVDDVCTTGSTLAACAEALQVAGAKQVWGFTLARAQ